MPKQFQDIDQRALVLQTTGIRVADDPKCHRAAKVVARLDDELLQRWNALKAGDDPDADREYATTVERARELGVTYLEAAEVARLPSAQPAAMVCTLNEGLMLGLPPIFDKVRLKGAKTNQRIPYVPAFVQERLLDDGVFDDVNEEARRVLYLMVETGLRLSEACNLNDTTIVLDHAVPHVRVKPDGRQMKTC